MKTAKNIPFDAQVYRAIEDLADCSTSDAQGIVGAAGGDPLLAELETRMTAGEAAAYILEITSK